MYPLPQLSVSVARRPLSWFTFCLLFIGAFGLQAAAATLLITTKTLPNATGGAAYDQAVVATGGAAPYTWAIQSGGLPPGLALGASTGQVTGVASTSSWVYSYPFALY